MINDYPVLPSLHDDTVPHHDDTVRVLLRTSSLSKDVKLRCSASFLGICAMASLKKPRAWAALDTIDPDGSVAPTLAACLPPWLSACSGSCAFVVYTVVIDAVAASIAAITASSSAPAPSTPLPHSTPLPVVRTRGLGHRMPRVRHAFSSVPMIPRRSLKGARGVNVCALVRVWPAVVPLSPLPRTATPPSIAVLLSPNILIPPVSVCVCWAVEWAWSEHSMSYLNARNARKKERTKEETGKGERRAFIRQYENTRCLLTTPNDYDTASSTRGRNQ